MDSNNLTQIIINLSQALGPVQHLISGMAYILGILLIITAFGKFYTMASAPRGSGGGENAFSAYAYFLGGTVLLYTPTSFTVLTSSVFGQGSVLQYASTTPVDIVSAMILLIQTVGLVWFVRGCVLVVSSSQPGIQEGPKGMVFLFAGILAMNFETTAAVLSKIMSGIASLF